MESKKEYIYSATIRAVLGLFISLSICVFFVGGNFFWCLIPIWMFFGGVIINFVFESIKPIANKKVLKYTIILLLAIATGVALRFLF